MFDQLGKLFDTELKKKLVGSKRSKKEEDIHKHLLIDDNSIGSMNREMQLKLGAALTQIMCKTLKYKIGNQNYHLLQPQMLRS